MQDVNEFIDKVLTGAYAHDEEPMSWTPFEVYWNYRENQDPAVQELDEATIKDLLYKWFVRTNLETLQKDCEHDMWVDEGYGNPDSGGDGGYCRRCGWGFWVQYY